MATFAKRVLQNQQHAAAQELEDSSTHRVTSSRKKSMQALSSSTSALRRIEMAISSINNPSHTAPPTDQKVQAPLCPPSPTTPTANSPPPTTKMAVSPVDDWKRQVLGQLLSLESTCQSLQAENTQLLLDKTTYQQTLLALKRENSALREALASSTVNVADIVHNSAENAAVGTKEEPTVKNIQTTQTTASPSPVSSPATPPSPRSLSLGVLHPGPSRGQPLPCSHPVQLCRTDKQVHHEDGYDKAHNEKPNLN